MKKIFICLGIILSSFFLDFHVAAMENSEGSSRYGKKNTALEIATYRFYLDAVHEKNMSPDDFIDMFSEDFKHPFIAKHLAAALDRTFNPDTIMRLFPLKGEHTETHNTVEEQIEVDEETSEETIEERPRRKAVKYSRSSKVKKRKKINGGDQDKKPAKKVKKNSSKKEHRRTYAQRHADILRYFQKFSSQDEKGIEPCSFNEHTENYNALYKDNIATVTMRRHENDLVKERKLTEQDRKVYRLPNPR